jgi:hypothetical protein
MHRDSISLCWKLRIATLREMIRLKGKNRVQKASLNAPQLRWSPPKQRYQVFAPPEMENGNKFLLKTSYVAPVLP